MRDTNTGETPQKPHVPPPSPTLEQHMGLFEATPEMLAHCMKLPPGNRIVGARTMPSGNIEFAVVGIDMPMPATGEATPRLSLMASVKQVNGETMLDTTWFEPN
jgi:hypothetical protein